MLYKWAGPLDRLGLGFKDRLDSPALTHISFPENTFAQTSKSFHLLFSRSVSPGIRSLAVGGIGRQHVSGAWHVVGAQGLTASISLNI